MSGLIAYKPPIFHGLVARRRMAFLFRAYSFGWSAAAGFSLLARFSSAQLRSLVDLVEMVGIALWLKMNIGLVVCDGGGLHWLAAHLLREFLTGVEGLLGHQVALLQPALGPSWRSAPGRSGGLPKTCTASPFFTVPVLLYTAAT